MRKLTFTHKFAMASLLVAMCAGCASTSTQMQTQYGNFTYNLPVIGTKVASDTIRQMIVLYPPASTRFNIRQTTTDAFGTALIEGLRAKGYGVVESGPEDSRVATMNAAGETEPRADGIDLYFVLDHVAEDLYRIMLTIGDHTLTRAYIQQGETAVPAGAWSRKG